MVPKNRPVMRTAFAAACIISLILLAATVIAGCTSADAPPKSATLQQPVKATPSSVPASAQQFKIPVERIIVTNVNSAELLVAIGAKDRIVGISDTVRTHPVLGPQFENVPSIGSWQTPDVEKILSLRPDVVICYSSYLPRNTDRITSAGITILPVDCYKIDTMASDTEKLGQITGRESAAGTYVGFLEKYEKLLRSRTTGLAEKDVPNVYFESYSDYSTLTGGSGADSLLALAGGKNIAALLPVSSPKVNAEWLVTQDPEIIVKTMASAKSAADMKTQQAKIISRAGLANVSAVKNGRAYVLSNDVVYGPRSIIGALYLAKILHPQQFADISPQSVLDEYAEKFAPGTNTTPAIYPQDRS